MCSRPLKAREQNGVRLSTDTHTHARARARAHFVNEINSPNPLKITKAGTDQNNSSGHNHKAIMPVIEQGSKGHMGPDTSCPDRHSWPKRNRQARPISAHTHVHTEDSMHDVRLPTTTRRPVIAPQRPSVSFTDPHRLSTQRPALVKPPQRCGGL